MPSTPTGLRQEINQFLSKIRFFTMTSEEFVQNVLTSDVLTPEENVLVLKNIAKPKADATASTMAGISLKINFTRESRASLITKVWLTLYILTLYINLANVLHFFKGFLVFHFTLSLCRKLFISLFFSFFYTVLYSKCAIEIQASACLCLPLPNLQKYLK